MNLLADESVERQIVERLRDDGHEVAYVTELHPGMTDVQVLERANASSALLLTADKDFGELVFRKGKLASQGVVLIRLAGLRTEQKANIISSAFHTRAAEFSLCFSIISPGMIRIRRTI